MRPFSDYFPTCREVQTDQYFYDLSVSNCQDGSCLRNIKRHAGSWTTAKGRKIDNSLDFDTPAAKRRRQIVEEKLAS
ncbi:unnamed protein product [Protopolystoma xenopodis]|uniref:Uncharacterized protein n=1 Tax=Protopolystoma xenopodis TaxID=117903 RepID=A0A3S5AE31_9PLAT|nr:unnamed protein product [Protopolystoma xenopodis]